MNAISIFEFCILMIPMLLVAVVGGYILAAWIFKDFEKTYPPDYMPGDELTEQRDRVKITYNLDKRAPLPPDDPPPDYLQEDQTDSNY